MLLLPAAQEVIRLEWSVECECGWTCRGNEHEVVAACSEHARREHSMELTREQVLAVAKPVKDANASR
jgi:predicted small metal-binding protein